jgi:hypothetical protein
MDNKIKGLVVVAILAGVIVAGTQFQVYQASSLRIGRQGGIQGQWMVWSANIGNYVVYVDSGIPAYNPTNNWQQVSNYCGYHVKVTESGSTVWETPTNGDMKWLRDYAPPVPFESPIFSLQPAYYGGMGGTCSVYVNMMINATYFSDRINVSIISPQSSYFKGQNATFSVKVTNNALPNLQFVSSVKVCTPVFSSQSFCQTYQKSQTLALGDNTFSLSLPTDRVTDQLTADIDYYIYFPDGYLSGDIYDARFNNENPMPTNQIDVSGEQTGTQLRLMIIPRPLVMQPPCVAGYTLKNNMCLSNDVLNLNLNCLVLGCPNVQGALYSCTSAGVCAETIIQTVIVNQDCSTFGCPTGMTCATDQSSNAYCLFIKNVDVPVDCKTFGCDAGLTCVTSEAGSSYCLKTQIQNIDCSTTGCGVGMTCVTANTAQPFCLRSEFVNIISQCNTSANCMTPCSGINVACNSGVCDYSGSCTPVSVGCRELGCGADYQCNVDRNVCEKTITNTITNTVTTIVTQVPAWAYLSIVLIFILLGAFVAMRR